MTDGGAQRLEIPTGIAEEMIAHARREVPNEACGLIAGSLEDGRASAYHPARNADRSPWTRSPGRGSAATILTPGRSRLRYRPTPVSVPPVPSPATNTSTSGTCARISGPVVASCTRALAWFAYWYGMNTDGSSAASRSASRIAPFDPSDPGEYTISAP